MWYHIVGDMMHEKITKIAIDNGCEIGFFVDSEMPLGYGISIYFPLSSFIISEIDKAPTESYFHHYRTVNAHLDKTALLIGAALQECGYNYYCIAASQSIRAFDSRGFAGRYSHKKGAVLSGIGAMGKNNLLLTPKYGAATRLATVFTDFVTIEDNPPKIDLCQNCNICLENCPSAAIGDSFDPQLCSDYMKKHFKMIGRGVVCGICIKSCPLTFQRLQK